MVAIVSNKREAILKAVEDMYTEVANRPAHPFHFPTGRRAAELVGYPPAELDALPATAVESFAGVGYPFAAGVLRAGDVVLDIGSGSGTDAILAARVREVIETGDMLDVLEADLAEQVEIGIFLDRAHDALGPELGIAFRLSSDGFRERDVADLEPSAGLEHAQDFADGARLVRHQVQHAVARDRVH